MSCDAQVYRLTSIIVEMTRTFSGQMKVSMNDVEDFARSRLPQEITDECVPHLLKTVPKENYFVAVNEVNFEYEVATFYFGYSVAIDGKVFRIYAKAK